MTSCWTAARAALLISCAASVALAQPEPTRLEGLAYDLDFFPGSTYDSAIPTPESLLGFRPGDRTAFPDEIQRCLHAWAEASPRARVVEYARSHEGRPLLYTVVTSPANMARLDEIKRSGASLADPRGLSTSEAQAFIEAQPAVAWMAYSIHGDETSGADASLAVLYHLIASTDAHVTELLDDVVVLIDSMQNPDGRQRWLQQIAEHRATGPNVDDQSMLHSGYWPWGRTNHYLFDLNRDWILGVNPESRGRIRAAGEWHPQLMVDGHEMGGQDTYLFSPAREPRNPMVPATLHEWAARFANDQADAFDRWKWPYYNAEWNEGWYPGYTDAWGQFRGAIGILYEQASFAEDGIRQAGGDIVTYREAVHHQSVSSLANLETLAANRSEILADYLEERRLNVAADSPWADRVFAVLPTANRSKLARFVDLMHLQAFEIYEIDSPATVGAATDQYGRRLGRTTLPAGTILIPNRQPEARLLAAMLEFDSRMPTDYLERERGSILRDGDSTIYDSTAWNVTMLYGLDGLSLSQALPSGVRRLEAQETAAAVAQPSADAVAWIVDGADDASVAYAARLLERGVGVRVGERQLVLGEQTFARGSVVILPADNRRFEGDLAATITKTAGEVSVEAAGVDTGFGEGDLPDLGGGHFKLLEPPRIALLSRGGISSTDYGSIWHLLDLELGVRHSQLDETAIGFTDLRRYNLLVVPSRWFGSLSEQTKSSVTTWVKAGGTLIAIGGSAREIAKEEMGLTSVRLLRDVVGKPDSYRMAVLREALAQRKTLPSDKQVWSHVAEEGGSYPWEGLADLPDPPATEELERRDEWDRMFMPQGAFLAARADQEHWLTLGVDEELPVLANSDHALMAAPPAEAPLRFGVFDEADDEAARRLGWSVVPAGHELRLRMSGLLWPEAAARLANSAAVTQESLGNGQVILFANSPTFRASTRGTARLLLNAMIYGPAFGASAPIVEVGTSR